MVVTDEVYAYVLGRQAFKFDFGYYKRYRGGSVLEESSHTVYLADQITVALGKHYFLPIAEELILVAFTATKLCWDYRTF